MGGHVLLRELARGDPKKGESKIESILLNIIIYNFIF